MSDSHASDQDSSERVIPGYGAYSIASMGVVLWALHGTPPVATLEADVHSQWLGEAAVGDGISRETNHAVHHLIQRHAWIIST